MKFVIASLSRCGSTAVYRVLTFGAAASIAYEPPFFGLALKPDSVRRQASKCLKRFDGIKHVWDPNGWPFREPAHRSTLDALARSEELVAANAALLDCADRVAVLRRRSSFERTLSDLLGQQTDLWGHDPDMPHAPSEASDYKAAVRRHEPSAIDPDIFGWYMANAGRWEDSILVSLRHSTARIFHYEDLFAPEMPDACRSAWQELFDWVDVQPDFLAPEVQEIVSPASKLNSADIYERIPNYRELKATFGDRIAA